MNVCMQKTDYFGKMCTHCDKNQKTVVIALSVPLHRWWNSAGTESCQVCDHVVVSLNIMTWSWTWNCKTKVRSQCVYAVCVRISHPGWHGSISLIVGHEGTIRAINRQLEVTGSKFIVVGVRVRKEMNILGRTSCIWLLTWHTTVSICTILKVQG